MLTVNQIKALPAKKTAYYKPDNTGERGTGRLTVQVTPAGSKIFKFKYHKEKKEVFIALGKFPALTLSKARDLANEYSEMLSKGLDPKNELERQSEEKKTAEREKDQLGTFEQLIEFHKQNKQDNGNRSHEDEYQLIVKNVFPHLDIHRKAKDFETEDFLDILAIPIEQGFDDKSNKIRSILHAAFNFALGYENNPKHRKRGTKFAIKNNPISNIPKQPEKTGSHYLSWEEVIQLLYDMEYRYQDLNLAYLTRQALKLCFHLYGQRPYEVLTIAWNKVDFKNRTVLISEEFHKTKKNHLVPLTDSAIEIFKDLKENTNDTNSQFVFYKKTNSAEHMPTNTIAQAIITYKKATKVRPFITRDIRRTVKTLGGEVEIPKEYRDRIQGHAINDVSGRHYDMYEYLKEKRKGLEIWEKALNKRLDKLKCENGV
ncbi:MULTISPECIES: site-specific integrase [unclassified Vibrio]|uniref:tyrosine-type recombinase/integrase n=1 Tax=Vibrio TaxID=662 RepID=UPI001A8C1123|nr:MULTISPECIES: site-specific integrase [unclassified Vibrio]MBO0208781.1 integrase arm-type DNA-binding domain-containing protein [Vibrio sp. Vb0877]MDW1646045.1 integrase arm-type DNA-binding domain-containing protein [Vibrio sp. Vb2976]MDW1851741.1 integrase arm-type DNA-binding domain-containing protein [Vibrio sp. Vb0888]